MTIDENLSNDRRMSKRTVTATIPPKFSKAARALLNLSQEDVAEQLGISPSTIRRYEGGIPMNAENDAKFVAFLRQAGISFLYRKNEIVGLWQGHHDQGDRP